MDQKTFKRLEKINAENFPWVSEQESVKILEAGKFHPHNTTLESHKNRISLSFYEVIVECKSLAWAFKA